MRRIHTYLLTAALLLGSALPVSAQRYSSSYYHRHVRHVQHHRYVRHHRGGIGPGKGALIGGGGGAAIGALAGGGKGAVIGGAAGAGVGAIAGSIARDHRNHPR
jgi:outer membrane lipoprotein SlyB